MDDLPTVWKRKGKLDLVKRSLNERFEMKDLGTTTFLLGIELRRHGGGDVRTLKREIVIALEQAHSHT